MTNRPKAIGTAGETAVARWLQANGIAAERLPLYGALDRGDLASPCVCWEVKAGAAAKTASDGQVDKWLVETERERINANAVYGVLVMARAGIGPLNAGQWWAIVPGEQLVDLIADISDSEITYGGAVFGKPVRLHLSTICTLLRAAGYGTPLTTEE